MSIVSEEEHATTFAELSGLWREVTVDRYHLVEMNSYPQGKTLAILLDGHGYLYLNPNDQFKNIVYNEKKEVCYMELMVKDYEITTWVKIKIHEFPRELMDLLKEHIKPEYL